MFTIPCKVDGLLMVDEGCSLSPFIGEVLVDSIAVAMAWTTGGDNLMSTPCPPIFFLNLSSFVLLVNID